MCMYIAVHSEAYLYIHLERSSVCIFLALLAEILRDGGFRFLDEGVFVQIAQDFFDDGFGAACAPARPLREVALCCFADDVAAVVGDAALCARGQHGREASGQAF